ncbi:hypothetical protein, partial [Streptomyces venezuelae]
MTLDELITTLDAADPTLVLPHGFTNPHSYRGYYEELAFEPATNVSVADMLADARSALGTTFTGWKGGEFTMRGYTDCWLAQEGSAGGETLGPLLLQFMLSAGIQDAAHQASGQQPDPGVFEAAMDSEADPKAASKDTAHCCGNCDGIDPDTCLTNPNRPKQPPMDPAAILGIAPDYSEAAPAAGLDDNQPATEAHPPT